MPLIPLGRWQSDAPPGSKSTKTASSNDHTTTTTGTYLFNRHNHVHALHHPAKHSVLAIQPCKAAAAGTPKGPSISAGCTQHIEGSQAMCRHMVSAQCQFSSPVTHTKVRLQNQRWESQQSSGGLHGVGTVVMKNWLPFVPGPALAMDTVKGRSWRKFLQAAAAGRQAAVAGAYACIRHTKCRSLRKCESRVKFVCTFSIAYPSIIEFNLIGPPISPSPPPPPPTHLVISSSNSPPQIDSPPVPFPAAQKEPGKKRTHKE